MDAWNEDNPCLDAYKKNFEKTGLIIAVLKAYKSNGTTPLLQTTIFVKIYDSVL